MSGIAGAGAGADFLGAALRFAFFGAAFFAAAFFGAAFFAATFFCLRGAAFFAAFFLDFDFDFDFDFFAMIVLPIVFGQDSCTTIPVRLSAIWIARQPRRIRDTAAAARTPRVLQSIRRAAGFGPPVPQSISSTG